MREETEPLGDSTLSNANQKPGIVDDPAIRETYANKVISSAFDGGSIVVTLGCMRINQDRIDTPPTRAPEVQVSTRLVLSPPAAMELINGLNQILTALSQRQAQPPPPMDQTTAH